MKIKRIIVFTIMFCVLIINNSFSVTLDKELSYTLVFNEKMTLDAKEDKLDPDDEWYVDDPDGILGVQSQAAWLDMGKYYQYNGKVDGKDFEGKIKVQAQAKEGTAYVYFKKDGDPNGELIGYKITVIKSTVAFDPGGNRGGTTSNVDVLENIESYRPGGIDTPSKTKIETVAGNILTVITNIGIVASVLILAVLGIKYMIGSSEEKAEYKQDLIPYFVGATILFGITTLVRILVSLGNSINIL